MNTQLYFVIHLHLITTTTLSHMLIIISRGRLAAGASRGAYLLHLDQAFGQYYRFTKR
jgi:hypothetical protein